jgi:hypothetical protein
MSNTIATSIQCESDNTDDEPIRPTTDVSDNGLEDESDTDQPADTNSDADQADAFDIGSEDNSDNVPQPQGKKAASKSKKSKPNGSIPKTSRPVRMICNPKDITRFDLISEEDKMTLLPVLYKNSKYLENIRNQLSRCISMEFGFCGLSGPVEDWDSYHDDDEMDVASPPLKRRKKMTEVMMFHADRVSESVTRFTSAINQQTLGPLSTIQNGGNTLATLWNLTLVLEQETIVPKARVLIQYVLLGAEFERRLKYLHAQLLQLLMWHRAEGNPKGAAQAP